MLALFCSLTTRAEYFRSFSGKSKNKVICFRDFLTFKKRYLNEWAKYYEKKKKLTSDEIHWIKCLAMVMTQIVLVCICHFLKVHFLQQTTFACKNKHRPNVFWFHGILSRKMSLVSWTHCAHRGKIKINFTLISCKKIVSTNLFFQKNLLISWNSL